MLRTVPLGVLALVAGCVDRPAINEGTLQVQVTGIASGAASVAVLLSGPHSERREVGVSGDRAELAFELIAAGDYRIGAESTRIAGLVIQRAAEQAVQVTAGETRTVELALAAAATDAGTDAAVDSGTATDAGSLPDTASDAAGDRDVVADAGRDGSDFDAAGGDRDSADAAAPAAPAGRIASGFPKIWNGEPNDNDRGYAVAIDGAGAAWIVGTTYDSNAVMHMALWKYAADGELAAGYPLLRGDGAGGHGDLGLAVAVRSDQVWVAGCGQDSSTTEHLMLWRFDLAGVELAGSPTVAGSSSRGACGRTNRRYLGLAIDGDGNGWVAGRPRNAAGNDDMGLWKFDPNGALVAGFPVLRDGDAGHVGEDVGAAIAIDGAGQVWVAGWSLDPAQYQQLALWKFDPAGAIAAGFPKIQVPPAGHWEQGRALAIAGDAVWVAGRSCDGSYVTDAAFWRFDLDGNLAPGFPLLWNGAADHTDDTAGIAVDPSGTVWAAGTSVNAAGDQDFALWRIERRGAIADGFPLLRDDEAGGGFHEYAGTVALDRDGALWIAGASYNADVNQDLVLWKFE